jgi:hypothetical protein
MLPMFRIEEEHGYVNGRGELRPVVTQNPTTHDDGVSPGVSMPVTPHNNPNRKGILHEEEVEDFVVEEYHEEGSEVEVEALLLLLKL